MNSTKNLQKWLPYTHWLFIIGCLCWFSSLSIFNLGIDQEFALFRTDQMVWLNQGRWVNFLISQYIYTQPVLYFFPHLFFIGCAVIAYLFILDSVSIPATQYKKALLLFPLFCAHPFWFFINEFYANIIPTSLGLLCSAFAVWLYSKELPLSKISKISAQLIALSIAIGAYQAFLFVAFALYIGVILWQMHSHSLKHNVLRLLQALGIIALSLVANYGFQYLLFIIYSAEPEYTNQFLHLHLVLEDPVPILKSILTGIKNSYWGEEAVYTSSLFGYGLIMIIGIISLLKTMPRSMRWFGLIVLAGWLISPFSLNFLSGAFAYTMPFRTFLAVPIVMFFVGLTALMHIKNSKWLALCISLTLIGNVQILHAHSRYTSAKLLLIQHDQQVAAQLMHRIYALIPDFQASKPYNLDVLGGISYFPPYSNVISSATNGSFFNWDDGNPYRIIYYLQALGFRGLTVNPNYEQRASLRPLYNDMPVWPAQGSVKVQNNTILVKFADR